MYEVLIAFAAIANIEVVDIVISVNIRHHTVLPGVWFPRFTARSVVTAVAATAAPEAVAAAPRDASDIRARVAPKKENRSVGRLCVGSMRLCLWSRTAPLRVPATSRPRRRSAPGRLELMARMALDN